MALNIPAKVSAGDSIVFTDSLSSFPASQGWSLSYALVNEKNKYSLTSTQNGDEFVFDIDATVTALFVAASYKWAAYITDGVKRFTVGNGDILVSPNFAGGPVDSRTHNEKMVAALEAMLIGKASIDQQSMSINGRSLTRYAFEDLSKQLEIYRAKLNREKGNYKSIKTRL